MTPERLTYKSPTPYARDGGNFMSDTGFAETVAGMEKIMQQETAKRAVEISEAEKQAQEEAKKAAIDAAKAKMDKLLQRQKKEEEREKKKEEKEGEKAEGSAKKEGEETKKENAPKAKTEAYFPKIPSSVAQEVQSFCDVAGGRPLSEIPDTKLITGYYIRLRGRAEEKGEDLNFLSEFKKELESRGVKPDEAYKTSAEYYTQLLKKEHERLQEEGALSSESQIQKALIEDQLEKQGKVLERIKTDELRQEWYATFTQDELKDQNTRSTVEVAIKLGLRPKEHTSKDKTTRTAEEVIKNSLLNDKDRIVKAQEILKQLEGEEKLEELTQQQEKAILNAHYVGKGEKGKDGQDAGVYNYTQAQLAKKAEILRAAGFTPEQTRKLIEAGIAAEPIDAADINDPALRRQATILNTALIDIPDEDLQEQKEVLNQALNRVSNVPGADQGQQDALAQKISDRLVSLRRQSREASAHRREQEESEHGQKVREEVHLFVDKEEAKDPDIDPGKYKVSEVQDEAREIKAVIEAKQADNVFLKEKIDRLLAIKQQLQERGISTEEAIRLRGKLQDLKNFLTAEERTKRLEDHPRLEGLYGDIRMSEQERAELIENALAGETEKIEERFNQLFATADAHTDDDWRDAQGQASDFEVRDFTRKIDAIASDRVVYKKDGVAQKLTQQQKDTLNEISRNLAQEVKLRELLHNVSYYTNGGFGIEDIGKLMKNFTAKQANFAYSKKGVVLAQHLFEQSMLRIMVQNGGYLRADAMVNKPGGKPGEVEQLVRDQIAQAKKLGEVDLAEWEISRAISLARGMGIVSARTFELVAANGIPAVPGSSLDSWWANDIVKRFAYFRQLQRYDVGIEHNKLLGMKLEDASRVWHTSELTKLGSLNDADKLARWNTENNDDRFYEMQNPFNIGSLYTQTGWRWAEENKYMASAIAHLLKDNPFNPLIGAGMWIEKRRRAWSEDKEEFSKKNQAHILEARRLFGVNVSTEAELSALLIGKNLDLAADITPLKLFYNLTGLRQQVLREYCAKNPSYASEIREEKGGFLFINQIKGPGGDLIDGNLRKDIAVLAVIQDGLLTKRADAYKKFLDGKGEMPNLYNEFTNLKGEIEALRDKLEDGQADRIWNLAENIHDTFKQSNHKDRLMTKLKDKGWKVPYVLGTDDIPLGLYNFAATGETSFARRWGDIGSVDQAAGVFEKNILNNISKFRDPDSIVKGLDEFYLTMKGHDEGRTRDLMLHMVEAIIKFYKKDILASLPAGIGTLYGMTRGASYAEKAFGKDAMSWDALDINEFIGKVRAANLLNPKDIKILRKRVGAKRLNIGIALGRTGIPLGILGFLFYMFSAEMKGLKLAA